MYPRETLVEDVKIMDEMFKEYHQSSSDGLLRTVNVINGLVEIFAEKFEHKYDRKLLKKFANCRTMHRMRWVQRQMKAHQQETLRSKRKKLEHHYSGNPNATQNNPSQPIPNSSNSQNSYLGKNPLMFALLHQLVTKIQKIYFKFLCFDFCCCCCCCNSKKENTTLLFLFWNCNKNQNKQIWYLTFCFQSLADATKHT